MKTKNDVKAFKEKLIAKIHKALDANSLELEGREDLDEMTVNEIEVENDMYEIFIEMIKRTR